MAGYDSEQFSLDLLQVDERLRQVIQAVYIDYYYSNDDEDGIMMVVSSIQKEMSI